MSVQAGIWNVNGGGINRAELQAISLASAQYGPDGEAFYWDAAVGVLYRPRYTTRESRYEQQPFISASGKVATWDGRLDNREDLKHALSTEICGQETDLAIAVAAIERWGTEAFARLRGDWALVIWDPLAMELVLARDYMGIRPLFYYPAGTKIIWCTCLAPLALSGDKFTLCDEYIAGYLAFHPDAHLTPYQEILSVPPGSFVHIRESGNKVQSYWRFNTDGTTVYKTDAEYEEHYRYLFRQAVRRRLRTDSPVLSELSGGLDSSSIVCTADEILRKKQASAPRLDTFSYYDSNEPGEDDYAHFSQVEEKRGRIGFRVDLKGSGQSLPLEYSSFPATPGFGSRAEIKTAFSEFIAGREYRVMLSGTGGDEINGQPLDPCVLMAEILLRLRFVELGKSLTVWSLRLRKPWIELLFQTLLQFFPTGLRAYFAEIGKIEPWVDATFARKFKFADRQLEKVDGVGVLRPSARDAVQTIETLRHQFTFMSPSPIEKRYPYLDQEFVEYLMSVPLNQLLRPGERRSLMRRSLADLLPHDVAIRKTKTGASRCYSVALERNWAQIESLVSEPLIARARYVNQKEFYAALLRMRNGQLPKYFLRLLKALSLELWLRELNSRGVIAIDPKGFAPAPAGAVGPSIVRQPPSNADCPNGALPTRDS